MTNRLIQNYINRKQDWHLKSKNSPLVYLLGMMQIMRNAVMEWSEKNINSNCLKHHKSTIQLTKNAVENEQKKKQQLEVTT
jgi:hypothetical protein